MQRTRIQKPRIRSAYSRQQPPPFKAPPGVDEITGWQLAARQWRQHLPDAKHGAKCESCRAAWPCPPWDIANDILNDSRDTAATHVS